MAQHPHTSLRSHTATPTAGSQTILQTEPDSSVPSATLRLRGTVEPDSSNRVRWAEDVVDNEGMGKKSSKVCCIYHKPHEPGDSDGDDSSSGDSDSDSEPDLSRARKAGGGKGSGRRHDHGEGGEGSGKGKGNARRPSPNAYERVPKQHHKKES